MNAELLELTNEKLTAAIQDGQFGAFELQAMLARGVLTQEEFGQALNSEENQKEHDERALKREQRKYREVREKARNRLSELRIEGVCWSEWALDHPEGVDEQMAVWDIQGIFIPHSAVVRRGSKYTFVIT